MKQIAISSPCFKPARYNDWFKVGCILRSICSFKEGLRMFVNASYVEPYNNETEKQNTINKFCNEMKKYNKYTMKSLDFMCLEANKDLYEELFPSKYMAIDHIENNQKLAEKMAETITQSCNFCGGKTWYSLNKNNLWVNVNPIKNITMEALRYVDYNLFYHSRKLNQAVGEDERKGMRTTIERLNKRAKSLSNDNTPIKKIKEFLEPDIIDTEFEKKLDKKRDIMAFKNGVMDLKNKIFQSGFKPDDYLTTHIPFDYNGKHDVAKYNFLKEKIKQIMNNN
jgi:hypothetical protein